jgi:hypothetical protein
MVPFYVLCTVIIMGIAIAQAPVFFFQKMRLHLLASGHPLSTAFRQLSTKAKDCSELVA